MSCHRQSTPASVILGKNLSCQSTPTSVSLGKNLSCQSTPTSVSLGKDLSCQSTPASCQSTPTSVSLGKGRSCQSKGKRKLASGCNPNMGKKKKSNKEKKNQSEKPMSSMRIKKISSALKANDRIQKEIGDTRSILQRKSPLSEELSGSTFEQKEEHEKYQKWALICRVAVNRKQKNFKYKQTIASEKFQNCIQKLENTIGHLIPLQCRKLSVRRLSECKVSDKSKLLPCKASDCSVEADTLACNKSANLKIPACKSQDNIVNTDKSAASKTASELETQSCGQPIDNENKSKLISSELSEKLQAVLAEKNKNRRRRGRKPLKLIMVSDESSCNEKSKYESYFGFPFDKNQDVHVKNSFREVGKFMQSEKSNDLGIVHCGVDVLNEQSLTPSVPFMRNEGAFGQPIHPRMPFSAGFGQLNPAFPYSASAVGSMASGQFFPRKPHQFGIHHVSRCPTSQQFAPENPCQFGLHCDAGCPTNQKFVPGEPYHFDSHGDARCPMNQQFDFHGNVSYPINQQFVLGDPCQFGSPANLRCRANFHPLCDFLMNQGGLFNPCMWGGPVNCQPRFSSCGGGACENMLAPRIQNLFLRQCLGFGRFFTPRGGRF